MLKTIKHSWRKLKMTQRNGKTSYVHGLEEQILLKCLYYPMQSTHLMQFYQNNNTSFHRAGTNNPKICMEPEKTPNCQGNVEKENWIWGHHDAWLQAILQSCDHQDSMVLAQKQTHRPMEQNRELRNGLSTLWSTNLWQSRKGHPMVKKTVSSINGAGKIGQLYTEEWNLTTLSHHHKDKLQMDERPRCEIGTHQNPRGEHRL